MANTKISAFTAETNVANITGFAAFKTVGGSSTNVRISGSEIESTLNLSNFAVGTLAVGRGGTGQTSYTDGDLLIGNTTGNTLAVAKLTQGTDLSITNGNGSISIGHAAVGNTPGSNSTTLSAGGTFTAINSVTVSAQGHLTAQNTETYTLPSDSNTTYDLTAPGAPASAGTLRLSGSDSTTDNVSISGSNGITISQLAADNINIVGPTLPTAANPSATISGTVVNGSASTFMRSDAVPALGSTITIGTGGSARGLVDIEGGNSLDAQLRLNCSAGTHAVVIEGPQHSGGNNYIIKLPHGAPALNKILKVGTYAANSGTYADPSLATMIWADDTDTDTSIYAANGSLTGARTVTMGSYSLSFASTTAGQQVKFGQNVRIDGQSYTPLETISSVTSWTPNWDIGNVQTMELSGTTTINNPSNIEVGATYIIILKQDGEGAHTVSWGSQYKFPAGNTPTMTTTANKADVITLVAYSSTVLMCTSVQDFATS